MIVSIKVALSIRKNYFFNCFFVGFKKSKWACESMKYKESAIAFQSMSSTFEGL